MNNFSAFWTRLFALTRKETKQLIRDKSSMAIGFILPIILILLFGYGLSFHFRIFDTRTRWEIADIETRQLLPTSPCIPRMTPEGTAVPCSSPCPATRF